MSNTEELTIYIVFGLLILLLIITSFGWIFCYRAFKETQDSEEKAWNDVDTERRDRGIAERKLVTAMLENKRLQEKIEKLENKTL